jgi:hypothetical protein
MASQRPEIAMTILPPKNEDWGFWGTIRHHAGAAAAWPLAMQTIGAATRCPDWAVRDFLDSRSGRHFADEVANELVRSHDLKAAIETAVDRWMRWTTNRRTAREYGIPRGLPYLTGFVAHCEIMAEPG